MTMYDPQAWNPTGRFSGLADIYAKHRPDYPAAAIDFILAHCGLAAGALVIDVGCGTGISSRQLAERGLRVIGIEPNADMRKQAESFSRDPKGSALEYREGTAEATGIGDSSADAVLAAQAFHWFDPEPTLREFCRILKPCGWVVLMWNERDESDPFTAAFGDVIRTARDATAVEAPRPRSGNVLLTHPLFTQGERVLFKHEQMMDEEGMLGRAFSMSFSPKSEEEAAKFAAMLREVFGQFQKEGKVVLRYETSVTVGRKT